MTRLSGIKDGEIAIFIAATGGVEVNRKLTDMGLLPGQKMKVLHNSGHGQITVSIKGSKLAVGHGLAKKIAVRKE